MIKFENWRITCDKQVLVRQYDNLWQELRIEGSIPEGWIWDLLIQAGDNLNVITLTPSETGLSVKLTEDILALSGYYNIQLRGTRGEEKRHTNIISLFIPQSLSGDTQWPELPTAFSQAEEAIRDLNAHPPIPGDNGFWLLWSLQEKQYVSSQLSLPQGIPGPPGPKGDPFTYEDFTPEQINDLANAAVKLTESALESAIIDEVTLQNSELTQQVTKLSGVAGKVVDQGDGTAYSVRVISQADYEALEQAGTVDPATLYFVEEDGNGG